MPSSLLEERKTFDWHPHLRSEPFFFDTGTQQLISPFTSPIMHLNTLTLVPDPLQTPLLKISPFTGPKLDRSLDLLMIPSFLPSDKVLSF